jgi:hypothetical protein
MITKKDIPLDLLKIIEPIIQANLDIVKHKKEEDAFYNFVENDTNSNNFFKIYADGKKKVEKLAGGNYALQWKPLSSSNTKAHVTQLDIKKVQEALQNWVKIIRDINETPSVHDDNFAKQYADFYYNEFKIGDNDADISPFNPKQQELIEVYLLSLATAIEQSENKLDVREQKKILEDISLVQSALPSTTKSQVMKGITKIFGKLYKISKSFAKEIIEEAKNQLIKKLIDLGIEYGPKLLEAISKHHN